jgi:lysyl-tRNA synthetase class 1
MFQKPRAAKRLFFDVIPRAVDEYLAFADAFTREEPARRIENPAWHIHDGRIPENVRIGTRLSFTLLLNLAGAANAETKDVMWGFIRRYQPGATPEALPFLDTLVERAVNYYQDQVKPTKVYRAPTEAERAALAELRGVLAGLPADAPAEDIQNQVFEVGKRHGFTELRAWFQALYEVLLGQTTGPRMGSFIALYGIRETVALIDEKLGGP